MCSTSASSLFSVAGKNVLVTGGSRGIGLMIAKGFARHGAKVLITSRDENACDEASTEIGHECLYISSNMNSRQGCVDLAAHTKKMFNGRLDVLVNNAGCSWGETLDRDSGSMNWGWDKVLDLNVKGIFYLTRECIPLLQRQYDEQGSKEGQVEGKANDPGRVINLGSVAGLVPQVSFLDRGGLKASRETRGVTFLLLSCFIKLLFMCPPFLLLQEAPTHAYDVSKAAVHHLTKKLAGDLSSHNITVNAVAPGFVLTKMSQGLGTWSDLGKIAANVPLRRLGNEDDMAGACIYLASRAGAYCTGAILNVDGGTVGALQIPMSSL